jgi:hypothetical protein
MRVLFLAMVLALSFAQPCCSALMGPGDIAFIGFNSDGSDDFTFVTLVDIDPSTQVFFSENEWNGGVIGSTGDWQDSAEGFLLWTSGATPIAAGTVISANSAGSASRTITHGTLVQAAGGTFNLTTAGECLYAYLGTDHDLPTAFLSAVATDAAEAVFANTGLVDGTNAQLIVGDDDIMAYIGPRTGMGSFAAYWTQIGNDANWIFEDRPGSDHNNSVAPDVPFDSTAFTTSAAASPEPSGLLLAVGGLLSIAATRRRRRV